MQALSDDDRELWLSRYLDGELDEQARGTVAEKLRTDARWRAEFEELRRTDAIAAAGARRYHTDDGFSAEVVRKVKARAPVAARPATPPHAHKPVRRVRRSIMRWPMRIAAMVALGYGAFWAWQTHLGRLLDNNSAARTPAPTNQPPATVAAITVTEEQRAMAWPDGTTVVARKGAVLEALDSRALKLDGSAFFKVARNEAVPFTIRSSAGHVVQALGTCFDLTTSPEGVRVRVAEGHVRVQSPTGKSADAIAGMEILTDLRVQPFDVRELSALWRHPDAEQLAAPWPQSGGSPGHSGMTPFAGPANLVARPKLFFAFAGETNRVAVTGAVIAPSGCAYVLVGREVPDELRGIVIAGPAQGRQCHVAANGGLAPFAPVITSGGLVVTVARDGMAVTARDVGSSGEERSPGWSYKAASAITGLCVTADGAVLLSTAAGLIALHGADGKPLWDCGAATQLRGPATVLATGLICAPAEGGRIHVVDRSGNVVGTRSWPRELLQAPVAAAGSDVWLASTDGYVARLSLEKSGVVEKHFGAQLKCAPISAGIFGLGRNVSRFDAPAVAAAPADDDVVALAQDGEGSLFVGYRKGVLHLRNPGTRSTSNMSPDSQQMKSVGFSNVAEGEIVKNGLAIVPGKLIVTTTRGIQVFE